TARVTAAGSRRRTRTRPSRASCSARRGSSSAKTLRAAAPAGPMRAATRPARSSVLLVTIGAAGTHVSVLTAVFREVDAHDLASRVDRCRAAVGHAGEVDGFEPVSCEQESMPMFPVAPEAHDLTEDVDPLRHGVLGARIVDRRKHSLLEKESVRG